jgi:hypothetical protein
LSAKKKKNNVEIFPNWKRTATPAERFYELARMAEKSPEHFAHVFVGWSDDFRLGGSKDDKGLRVRYIIAPGMTTVETLGLMRLLEDRLICAISGVEVPNDD